MPSRYTRIQKSASLYRTDVKYVSRLLERLPEKFDRHFYFDAWMIHSIVESWSNDLTPNSGMIIPTCYDEWGYEPITIPAGPTVSFIYIPSEVSEEIPSLLDYPWLCHELGHHLLLLPEHKEMLFNEFQPRLEELVSKLKRMSISDRGLAKTRSQSMIDEIDAKWRSSKWVEELAIDVIALWSCGPAYLAAFQEEHEKIDKPFIIESTHPPIELRTCALLQAARQLGWNEYLKGLEQIQHSWCRKIPPEIGNRYRSLRDPQLITSCVESALTYCGGVRIPRLSPEDLKQMRLNLRRKADFSDGIELIVTAWLMYDENKESYHDWEERTLNPLMDEIIQESVKQ